MIINFVDGLLHANLTLSYQGQTATINHLIIDTGAAQTLISADAVFHLGIFANPNDELITMRGIGGEDLAFRKVIDHVTFGSWGVDHFPLDFGDIDAGFGINGIIGLDILLSGKFVIDLSEMIITQK